MTIRSSPMLIGFLLVAFSLFVWRSRPHSRINQSFGMFTLACAGWSIGIGGVYTGYYSGFWIKFAFASACLSPGAFLALAQVYLSHIGVKSRIPIKVVTIAGLVLAGASLGTRLVVYDGVMIGHEFSRRTGPLYEVFALYFLSSWGL